ncbi:MAG TPA: hypothetical protein VFM25_04425 [Verrucomicrobiae bacterium]|nr:hypothetical protein [Verrucomicrobiae bacterium]
MKSAYELAMERLNKKSPAAKLSDDQKKQLAELDSKFTAKIAEREIALESEIARAISSGDFDKEQMLKQQLAAERKSLQSQLEEKKEEIRRRGM